MKPRFVVHDTPHMTPHPAIRYLVRQNHDDRWYLLCWPKGVRPKNWCRVKWCRKTSQRGEAVCPHCRMTAWRVNNPMHDAWYHLKQNAKRRKTPFALTLEEFSEFAMATGYIDSAGRFKGSLHIDRIDPTQGYVIGNIRTLTCEENSRKANEDKKYKQRHHDHHN